MPKVNLTGELMPYRGQKFSKDPTKGGKPVGPELGTIRLSFKEVLKQLEAQLGPK